MVVAAKKGNQRQKDGAGKGNPGLRIQQHQRSDPEPGRHSIIRLYWLQRIRGATEPRSNLKGPGASQEHLECWPNNQWHLRAFMLIKA